MTSEYNGGDRHGRFVILRDVDGTTHAVAAASVSALCDAGCSTTLLLPGGRLIVVDKPFSTVLGWLELGGTMSRPVPVMAERRAGADDEGSATIPQVTGFGDR